MSDILRVLYVNSEMCPYTSETPQAIIGRNLPQGTQERKREIRSFMPRYGSVNERKHQLHEVIRLFGINVVIGDVDRPLIIKVASIPSARMQVYFIDNEDYFHRKPLYRSEDGEFFADNAERAIFFTRGVLETVKKLRWAPDIIHCSGWMSHVLPLYLKKVYKDDPIFSTSKVVLSLYNDTPAETFQSDFASKILFGSVTPDDVKVLSDAPTGVELAKLAISHSDGVILSEDGVLPSLADFAKEAGKPVLDFDAASIADGTYIDEYNKFYDNL